MAQGKHLISVLIPTYNAPEYFRVALESARSQDYAPMEIIVCDNSTDDRTEQMMTSAPYADDPRITYVRNRTAKTKEENFAPFEHLVHGDYIQWLMHDDVLLPGKFRKMAAVLDTHPEVTLVASQRNIIDKDGNAVESWLQTNLGFDEEMKIISGEVFGEQTLRELSNYLGEPSGVLFRRSDLAHPYYHAESRGYKRISDVAMWLELAEKGDVAIFRDPLSSFRVHGEQEGQQPDVIAESRLEWLRLAEDYYARDVFLHTKEAYHDALKVLMVDFRAIRRNCFGQAQRLIQPVWRDRYLTAMQHVADELGMPLPSTDRVTACLIYRNEAARLQAWLANAIVYCDELVLVDTGSTDTSAQIVEAFSQTTPVQLRTIRSTWSDDFAAVRNFALDAAGGEWVTFLDADETFEDPDTVRLVLDRLPKDVAGVYVPIVNVDEDAGDQEISRFPALRIWRNAKNRRYTGRIHETLVEDGQALTAVRYAPNLTVRHTGYSTQRVQAKVARNLAILQHVIAHGEQDPRTLYRYLADCYHGLGDYENMLRYAMQAIEEEPETFAGKQSLYVLVLRAMKGLKRPLAEQLNFARAAHREHPDWLDLAAAEGVLAAACGEREAAEQVLTAFLAALDAAEQGDGSAFLQATGAEGRRAEACRTLAGLRLADGDVDDAASLLAQALDLARYDEQALTIWEAVCRAQGTAFLTTLSRWYDEQKKEDRAFLRGWVIHEGQAVYRAALAPDLPAPQELSCEKAIARGASEMPALFAALVVGGQALYQRNALVYEQSMALLPDGMRRILGVLLERPGAALATDEAGRIEDRDAYLTGLDALCERVDATVLAPYVDLALKDDVFDAETRRAAAGKLFDHELWALAFELFQTLAEDELGDAAAFWRRVGICLYHLHELAAEECFARAEAAGCTARDVAAYRAWMAAWRKEAAE